MAIKVTTTDGTTIEGTVEELKQLGITGGTEEDSTEESGDKLVRKKIRVKKCIDDRRPGMVGYGKIGQGVVNSGAEGELLCVTDEGIYVNITDNVDDDITSAYGDDLTKFYLRHGEYEVVRLDVKETEARLLDGKSVKATKCIKGFREGYVGFSEGGQGLVAIGSVGKVSEIVSGGIYVKFDEGETKTPGSKERVSLQRFFLADGEYELVDEVSHGFEVGDKVILDAGDSAGTYPLHGFSNGKEYEIEDLTPRHDKGGVMRIVKRNGNSGYALPSQLRHAETESAIEIGDIVRVLSDHHTGSRNDPGDIGVVERENDFGYYVEVANKTSINGNHHVEENLEIIARKADRLDV